jgi:hypothetical protein
MIKIQDKQVINRYLFDDVSNEFYSKTTQTLKIIKHFILYSIQDFSCNKTNDLFIYCYFRIQTQNTIYLLITKIIHI